MSKFRITKVIPRPPKTNFGRGYKGKAKKLAKRLNVIITTHNDPGIISEIKVDFTTLYSVRMRTWREIYDRLKYERWCRRHFNR